MRSSSTSAAAALVRKCRVTPPRIYMRLEQRRHRGHGDLRLEGDARDPAVARIEMGVLAGFTGERPIVVAQRIAQPVVAGGAAEGLDMLVLVERRDALCGQLPADPVRFLDEMDMPAPARGGEGRSHPAGAAADDKDVALDHACVRQVADGNHRDRRIAVDRHPHDIDQGLASAFHGWQLTLETWRPLRRNRAAGSRACRAATPAYLRQRCGRRPARRRGWPRPVPWPHSARRAEWEAPSAQAS